MEKEDKNIEVLLSLLQDIQETIRFIESKVGVLIILLSGIVALYINEVSSLITYFENFSCFLKILFSINAIGIIICFYYVARIILPVQNPQDKIPEPYKNYPNIYQAKNDFKNKKLIVSNIDEALKDDDSLTKSLELEYFKTSYIRNAKNANFNKLVIIIITSLVFTIMQFTVLKIEEKNDKFIENKCCLK